MKLGQSICLAVAGGALCASGVSAMFGVTPTGSLIIAGIALLILGFKSLSGEPS